MNDDKVSIRNTLFTKKTPNRQKQTWRLSKWELLNTSLEICYYAKLLNIYVHKMRRSITIAVTTVHHSTGSPNTEPGWLANLFVILEDSGSVFSPDTNYFVGRFRVFPFPTGKCRIVTKIILRPLIFLTFLLIYPLITLFFKSLQCEPLTERLSKAFVIK
jgi:hypothetical protein